MRIKEPTAEQCTQNEKVFENDDTIGYAIWFPQMGGYVGKSVALFDKSWKENENGSSEKGCIDIYVWHNGTFPFGDEEDNPREIHLCDPEQFIDFGKKLSDLNEKGKNIA